MGRTQISQKMFVECNYNMGQWFSNNIQFIEGRRLCWVGLWIQQISALKHPTKDSPTFLLCILGLCPQYFVGVEGRERAPLLKETLQSAGLESLHHHLWYWKNPGCLSRLHNYVILCGSKEVPSSLKWNYKIKELKEMISKKILSNLKFIILLRLRRKRVLMDVFSSRTRKTNCRQCSSNREWALKATEYTLLFTIFLIMVQNLSFLCDTNTTHRISFSVYLGNRHRGQVMRH